MNVHDTTITKERRQTPLGIYVRGLQKSYGSVQAVRGVDIDIRPGEFLVLLGPSGCGKTTMLRCVAGLEEPTGGTISLGSSVIYDSENRVNVPPNKRGLGMVFQSYAVWPHMTVAKNVGYPLRRAGVPNAEVERRVDVALKSVGLESMSDRLASALSGGQQQRVSLARALISQPGVVLFDEPLSSLDAHLRGRLRTEILETRLNNAFTGIYVTHDQFEALALADRIAVMRNGLIEQLGTPQDIYDFPATRFVAEFTGYSNFFDVEVAQTGPDLLADSPLGKLSVSSASSSWNRGQKGIVAIRSSQLLATAGTPPSGADGVRGKVISSAFLGEYSLNRIAIGDKIVEVRDAARAVFAQGDEVSVTARRETKFPMFEVA